MAGPEGVVIGVAVDHRDSFRLAMERRGLGSPSGSEIAALKTDLVAGLARGATVVLLDEEFGREALAGGAVPPEIALVMPLEAQGYEELKQARTTRLLEDFSPARAAWYGADGCKLLLPYRPDHEPSARRQDELVASVLDACHMAGLPLILEPIVYRRPEDDPIRFATAFPDLAVATAERLAELGPDILKVQFPTVADGSGAAREPSASEEACVRLDAACGPIPWVLLGGGGDAQTLAEQVRVAGVAGASGFIVGRTVWDAALVAGATARRAAIEKVCAPILAGLREAALASCRPLAGRSSMRLE